MASGLLIEIVGLQSPRGRLLFFVIISLAIFLIPYNWLSHLSIWQALHIPSPSIGLTRAYHLLLHGDISGAWNRNKLIFIVLALGLIVLLKDSFSVIKRRHANSKPAL